MKVSSRGRVTIPKDIRDQFGLTPGTQVDFVDLPDGVKIVKRPDSRFARLAGYLKDRWVIGDIDEYLRESRGR
jgi:AbrB family looped-hinge helix DNA binding protein